MAFLIIAIVHQKKEKRGKVRKARSIMLFMQSTQHRDKRYMHANPWPRPRRFWRPSTGQD
jgi:hypothetical protein